MYSSYLRVERQIAPVFLRRLLVVQIVAMTD